MPMPYIQVMDSYPKMPNFHHVCRDYGIKFIGATPEQINSMGDKASAKETMKKAGVPTIPGSEGLLESVKEGIKLAKEMGYPVILKATAGGGGRGMRVVWKDEEFENAWDSASQNLVLPLETMALPGKIY